MTHRARVVRFIVGVGAVLATAQSCGQASTPAGPSSPPRPALISYKVSGSTNLTDIGQTSQLTGTGTYSDGTTGDVTSQIQWSTSLVTVVTVSAAGVLKATGLGATYVNASLAGLFHSLPVRVTPAGTSVVYGFVREPGGTSGPGTGGILNVLVSEQASGRSTRSDQYGTYTLGGLTSGHLAFELSGFEPVQSEATLDASNDVALQKVIRIAAGASVSPTLAPHDMDYVMATGDHCYPCRLIRITVDAPGTLSLRVTWTESHSTLALWVAGHAYNGTTFGPSEVSADVPVGAGEVVVYVGKISAASVTNYVPFTLTTSASLHF